MSELHTLILETSTPLASVAIVSPGGRLEQREFTGDRSHNAGLFAPLQELLDTGVRGSLGLVLVGSGPGSYSGTRVGIAAAQGVAIAAGCPAVAVPSILAVPSALEGECLAIGDARRGSYWAARLSPSGLPESPSLTDEAGLVALVEASLAAGHTVFTFEDPARFPLPTECRDLVRQEFPDSGRLWQAWNGACAENRAEWTAEIPQPIYLKPPHITPAKRSWLLPSQA
ncbi:MAG: tRNA (adenosine(37)-N6)-threonylcarbamoyltransferase complex dimerization subunit type 1 TsaB [Verrucomicrobiaceae bacterium]|nr:MAG: tRNA (adenosine(37)-N6)-threonylcarbamoyltransferase complex dimerization subunit type 1 TsaB [Verrucomicrobiaceae bacterium]